MSHAIRVHQTCAQEQLRRDAGLASRHTTGSTVLLP